MTAQSAPERGPDDPVEILRILPSQFHEQFLAEYDAAVTGARRPEHYHELHRLLRLWRLRAAAYSDPGYESRLQAMQDAARTGRRDGTPIEEVVPDSAERVAAARRLAGRMTYRVEVEGAALAQLNGLPSVVFDALVQRVVALVQEPWDPDLIGSARQRPAALGGLACE